MAVFWGRCRYGCRGVVPEVNFAQHLDCPKGQPGCVDFVNPVLAWGQATNSEPGVAWRGRHNRQEEIRMPDAMQLKEAALEAIDKLFSDTSVEQSETREFMEEIIEEIELKLETLDE